MQASGFEVRHVESLREHYALTLRAWVANLERGWSEAVAEAGAGRARVWRLYMAASALNFEAGRTQVHQVLAVKADRGTGIVSVGGPAPADIALLKAVKALPEDAAPPLPPDNR